MELFVDVMKGGQDKIAVCPSVNMIVRLMVNVMKEFVHVTLDIMVLFVKRKIVQMIVAQMECVEMVCVLVCLGGLVMIVQRRIIKKVFVVLLNVQIVVLSYAKMHIMMDYLMDVIVI